MKKINLPNSDLRIGKAIFGTSRLGGTVSHFDKREALGILRTALEGGIDCFDTADIYAQGNSERLLAEAFKGRRDEVVIATKGGYVVSGKARVLSRLKPLVRKLVGKRPGVVRMAGKVRGGQMAKDFSPATLQSRLDASLRRLGTDRIDIYQLHSPDEETLARGDAFETLASMKQAGKIRAYGASLLSWDHLDHCMDKGVSFVQLEADLLARGERRDVLDRARDAGIIVVARQPFASGLLAKPPSEWTADDFGGDEKRLASARDRLARIREIGDPFEVILAHLMSRSGFPAFLFATTNPDHLEANLRAMASSKINPERLGGIF